MVFCNCDTVRVNESGEIVTILILVDGFLQYINSGAKIIAKKVTILILVDGFLQ